MSECNSFSGKFTSSPILGSTDSIVWNYAAIPCLEICTGERLTSVQYKIALKICELITLTDVSNIEIDCINLKTAFGTRDKTILEFIDFILEQLCAQLAINASIEDQLENIDPNVTINLSCCSDNPCVSTGTIKLSVVLQSLANCICEQKGRIDTLEDTIEDLQDEVDSAVATANSALATLTTINNSINTLTSLVTTANTRSDTFATAINSIISVNSFVNMNAITPVI